tara:strand:+ start:2707 stop:3177 length:471 start_codon:yes stop_codon:yes gene_type:complete
MNGKMKKMNLNNTYLMWLKSLLKTELTATYLASDGSRFFEEYEAVIYEYSLQQNKAKERRWNEMKTKIAELVCDIIKEKQWGIFFKHEPMKALPVQDETSLYKINEVNRDELMDAVMQALEERMSGWQERKANIKEEQIDNELSTGTNQTLKNIEE